MNAIPHHAKRALTRACLLAGLLAVFAAFATTPLALGAAEEFGIESVSASLSTQEAGRHPDLVNQINFKESSTQPVGDIDSLLFQFPAGLLGNRQNFEVCPLENFNNPFLEPCPQDAQVGSLTIKFFTGDELLREPIYNLPPGEGEFIRLGFIGMFFPTYVGFSLRSDGDYGVTVRSTNIASYTHIESITSKVWGVPADPSHDTERLTPLESFLCMGPDPVPCENGGSRASTAIPVPFMSNPSSCQPMPFIYETTTYLLPGQVFEAPAAAGDITDCDKVPFEPSLSLDTTNHKAGAPTGLEATLKIPQNEGVSTVNTSSLRAAKVELPEGMTVNAAAADGLAGCTAEAAGIAVRGPGHCPTESKLGAATIVSPNLERPIEGGVYLRTPEPGHLIRFWLISNELGVNLKVAGEVRLDPDTGRLTAVFPQAPQLPAEEVVLRFNGGPRAATRNPLSCGAYNAAYELTPWSGNAPATGTATIKVDEGCNTGGFDPKLSAGTMDPSAAHFSPFVFDLRREDGEQNIAGLDVALPSGLTAKVAGVPLCPDQAAATGNCPADSRIGSVEAAVGAGPLPLWLPQPGKAGTAAYLAGPYKGAPYSLVAEVPAQGGPFDLGMVVVRSAIAIDPETARITVKSDPLPQFVQGVAADYRRVRVKTDRSNFTLNPTSCEPEAVEATVRSASGASASPSDRFQAVECATLGFKPRLALTLKGKTARRGHPALHAALTVRGGDANLKAASVALPHSVFLDQAHIGTVCTRVQFAADACPARSIYGHARATTPLLDEPLTGPVYLRSSSHELPDLVMALHGPNGLEIDSAARIDSVRGGIRTSFEAIPDVPISKVFLDMQGGKKGLLVNSTDLCDQKLRATAAFDAQNGRIRDSEPVLRTRCGRGAKHQRGHN